MSTTAAASATATPSLGASLAGAGVEVTSYGGFTYLITVVSPAMSAAQVKLIGMGTPTATPAPGQEFITLEVAITNTSENHGTARDEPFDQVVYQSTAAPGLVLGALVLAIPSSSIAAFNSSGKAGCVETWFIVDPKLPDGACPLGTGLVSIPAPESASCCTAGGSDLQIPAGASISIVLASMDGIPANAPLSQVELFVTYKTCPMCPNGFSLPAPVSIPVPAD